MWPEIGSPLFIDKQLEPIPPAWLRKMEFCFAFPCCLCGSQFSFFGQSWPLTGAAHRPSHSLPSSAPWICRKPKPPPQHTPIPFERCQKRKEKREGKKEEKGLSGIPVGWRFPAIRGAVVLAACGGIRERAQRWKAHKCNEVPVTPAPLHTLNGSHWSAGSWGFKNTNYSNCLLCYWEDCNKRGAQHCRAMS